MPGSATKKSKSDVAKPISQKQRDSIVRITERLLDDPRVSKFLARVSAMIATHKEKGIEAPFSLFTWKGIGICIRVLPAGISHLFHIRKLHKAYKAGYFSDPAVQYTLSGNSHVRAFMGEHKAPLSVLAEYVVGIEPSLVTTIIDTLDERGDDVSQIVKFSTRTPPDYLVAAQYALQLVDTRSELKEELFHSPWVQNIVQQALEQVMGVDDPLIPQIMEMLRSGEDMDRVLAILSKVVTEPADYMAVARGVLSLLDGKPELKSAILNSPWVQNAVKQALEQVMGASDPLIPQIMAMVRSEVDMDHVLVMLGTVVSEPPDYMAAVLGVLSVLDSKPELKNAIFNSPWVQNAVKQAIEKVMGVDDPLIPQIMGMLRSGEDMDRVLGILGEVMAEPVDYMAVARGVLSLLDGKPELKSAILNSLFVQFVVTQALTKAGIDEQLANAVIELWPVIAQDVFEFIPVISGNMPQIENIVQRLTALQRLSDAKAHLQAMQILMALPSLTVEEASKLRTDIGGLRSQLTGDARSDQELVRELLKTIDAQLKHEALPELIQAVSEMLFYNDEMSPKLQDLLATHSANLCRIAGMVVSTLDPLIIAPFATGFNTDKAQRQLLDAFIAQTVVLHGESIRGAVTLCVNKNASVLASIIARTAFMLDVGQEEGLSPKLIERNKEYNELNDNLCAAMGLDARSNMILVMRDIVQKDPALKQSATRFERQFQDQIKSIAESGVRQILQNLDKAAPLVDSAVELVKGMALATQVKLGPKLVHCLKAFIKEAGITVFHDKRAELIRIGAHYSPAGRKGLGTLIDALSGDKLVTNLMVGVASKAITLGGKLYGRHRALDAAPVVDVAVDPSDMVKGLAKAIGDKVAFRLFGEKKDSARVDDTRHIIQHLEKVIASYPEGKESISDVFIKESVVQRLGAQYHEKSARTKKGLFSGERHMPEGQLTDAFAAQLVKEVQRTVVIDGRGTSRDGMGGLGRS